MSPTTLRLTPASANGRLASGAEAETHGGGKPAGPGGHKYYHAGGQRVAVRVNGALYFLHTDHLGSTSLATDQSGAVVAQQRYYPYGGVRWSSGTLPTDYTFTGQRWEAGLGLLDYRARYYDPALGRFVQADTVVPEPGNPQALNRYAYVYNRPLAYIDTDGHFPWPVVGVVIGGIVVGGVIGFAITPEWHFWNVPPITEPRVSPPTSPEMTQWLIDQMRANAQAPVTQQMRRNWSSLSPVRRVAALKAWTALVRTGAVWDFKEDIPPQYQPDVILGNSTVVF